MLSGTVCSYRRLLLLLYLSLALLYSAVNPLFESSDEMWHIGMAVRLARGEGLPVQRPGEETPWRQEGSQPPLYYALLAGLTRGFGLSLDDFEAIYIRNPYAWLGDPSRIANRNQVLHGSWERFPWRGAVLTLHLWRLVSVALGLLTVLATVNTVHLLFPDRPGWALGSGLLVAVNPMFLFITASVNNDNLVNAATATGLWLMALRFRRQGDRKGRPYWPRTGSPGPHAGRGRAGQTERPHPLARGPGPPPGPGLAGAPVAARASGDGPRLRHRPGPLQLVVLAQLGPLPRPLRPLRHAGHRRAAPGDGRRPPAVSSRASAGPSGASSEG
jgi:hypothetical protein